jgi:DNA-binding response OmpR family regulator
MFRAIIAEDDLMIANLLAEIIVKAGYIVCGVARTVDEAIDLGLSEMPHVAILDLRLADGRSATEIAARLVGRGEIGVLYSSGNISRLMLTAQNGHACLSKPYSVRALLRGLEIAMDIAAARPVSGPFPPGLRVLPAVPMIARGQSFRI